MFGPYKRSLDDANGLTTLLTLVLLDESVYKAQRNALIEFAKQLKREASRSKVPWRLPVVPRLA
jgi:hypothetical protein